MKRILSLAVALASAVALAPTVQAKPDKAKGGKGGGGGARVAHSAPGRPQARPSGNFGRVQAGRPSMQTQRLNRAQVHRQSPSVALTGRSRTDLQHRAAQQQRLSTQQRAATRGPNWNERRKHIIDRLQRQERWEDRREKWEDRRDDWKDRHDWDDHHHYVPFDVHRHWDHNRIYVWNNYRYRWYNNAWVVIDPGFGYGYDYGYYDYAPTLRYSEGYGGESLTARVQEELADEGYDPGPIDGVLGAQTRDAIIDFQRDNELPVTGRIDTPLLRELGL